VHASLPVTSSRSAMPAGCPTRLPLLLGRQLAGLAPLRLSVVRSYSNTA